MKKSSIFVPDHIRTKLDMLSHELKEIGIDYVGHGVISEKGDHTGYFSHKQWGNYYLEKGYFYEDPVLEIFCQHPIKIINWILVGRQTKNRKIIDERSQYTGVIQGITTVTKVDNHLEFLNLGFTKTIDLNQYLNENQFVLQSYMKVFRHHHTYQRISASL